MSRNDFWLVASPTMEEGREAMYSLLKSRLQGGRLIDFSAVFEIPLNFKYGRLDDLVRMADDLIKQDSFVEQACRRLERMGLEVDPSTEYKIVWQRNTFSAEQYLSRFIWDEAKYPRNRSLKQNIDQLVANVARLDEEVRVKAALFAEVKNCTQTTSKQEIMSFATRDLIDVLTPQICSTQDFIETEHLTTVVAIVPRNEVMSFPEKYWKWDDKVVPMSHKKYPPVDKDGATIWTFVCFRSRVDIIKERARDARIIIREFKFSENAFELKSVERARLEAERSKQESVLSRIVSAAFSECFINWVHLKAVRVFVEATLRYGLPPNFSAFVLRLAPKIKENKLRRELDDLFSSKYQVGRNYFGTKDEAGADDDGDYFPYVSLAITPFVQFVQK